MRLESETEAKVNKMKGKMNYSVKKRAKLGVKLRKSVLQTYENLRKSRIRLKRPTVTSGCSMSPSMFQSVYWAC